MQPMKTGYHVRATLLPPLQPLVEGAIDDEGARLDFHELQTLKTSPDYTMRILLVVLCFYTTIASK